jgi:hypothetical protein
MLMHLASNYIHPRLRGGQCRVRIYLLEKEQDAPVIICSELSNNEGSSATYSSRQIAAEVIRYHRLPTPVWIEHYRKEATDGLLIDANPTLNTATKGFLISGMQPTAASFRTASCSRSLGLTLTTVLTTMWAIFGGIRRTAVLYRNVDLAYLCVFSGQGGIPRYM